MSKKKKEWRAEKERLLGLSLEDRRKDYRGNYVPLEKISTWANHDNNAAPEEEQKKPLSLADKVSLYKGDITILEVDAIVNAANSSLLGGGGVDGCIHRAAGHLLYEECHSLNGCDTGKAKITCGYDLPAKYVIHTVGPIARGNVGQTQKDDLEACYKNSLKLMKDNNLRSVAFPCISTGIYGFPNDPAAEIALETVRQWILDNQDEIDRVIFCVFLETDYDIYKGKMSKFFSPDNDDQTNEKDDSMGQENTEPKEGGEDDGDPDKKGAKDDDKKIQQGAKDDDKSQPVEKEDDKKSQPDEKPDEEMMSQQEESTEDVPMESQKLDESSGGEPMEEEKPPEKKEPKVEPSPTAEKKLKQESKNEKEKKEGKGEDPQVAGDDKGGSPEKKMQTGQPDEPEKQMEGSKNADTKMENSQDTSDAMEVENADQSAIAAKENNTTSSSSTKDDVKTQDESSQEPNAADNRPKSEDGQGNGNPQE
ncbi:ADP-ribose glycohydrolase MACROD2 isoform X9 [Labeo rohita]|uniref:ADP-ribose glycohydrolase MACROD2 isoform X8 n=1 Tax=Labeo rohita TaxID=84645 RepID=UPI0021E26D8F|nr:ADP-ribose glycohydrolase MACROD2 isoform X8 [Labeo rohita]XP_050981168.1 ADP-ribose glycohydrolase MACROD2 isoform X9 [Labeo rohita]